MQKCSRQYVGPGAASVHCSFWRTWRRHPLLTRARLHRCRNHSTVQGKYLHCKPASVRNGHHYWCPDHTPSSWHVEHCRRHNPRAAPTHRTGQSRQCPATPSESSHSLQRALVLCPARRGRTSLLSRVEVEDGHVSGDHVLQVLHQQWARTLCAALCMPLRQSWSTGLLQSGSVATKQRFGHNPDRICQQGPCTYWGQSGKQPNAASLLLQLGVLFRVERVPQSMAHQQCHPGRQLSRGPALQPFSCCQDSSAVIQTLSCECWIVHC